MFDRVDQPARDRRGGRSGAPTTIARENGTAMKGKGTQFVPRGVRVVTAFPGGAGYRAPGMRDPDSVRRELANGHITPESARHDYDMSPADIEDVMSGARVGEIR